MRPSRARLSLLLAKRAPNAKDPDGIAARVRARLGGPLESLIVVGFSAQLVADALEADPITNGDGRDRELRPRLVGQPDAVVAVIRCNAFVARATCESGGATECDDDRRTGSGFTPDDRVRISHSCAGLSVNGARRACCTCGTRSSPDSLDWRAYQNENFAPP